MAVNLPWQLEMPETDQPIGEWPGLPPNFWRSHITPRIVDCAWTYSSASGTGYNSDRMWSSK